MLFGCDVEVDHKVEMTKEGEKVSPAHEEDLLELCRAQFLSTTQFFHNGLPSNGYRVSGKEIVPVQIQDFPLILHEAKHGFDFLGRTHGFT